MKTLALALAAALTAASAGFAQQASFDRLSRAQFDAVPPSARVSGTPGRMTIRETSCRSVPDAQIRRRIVDLAVQEWAFFGFTIVDQTAIDPTAPAQRRPRRGFSWLGPEESARVADAIGGYWSVTPEGSWILESQNEAWNGPGGVAARWRYPWSAAFLSWVMCEGGLGDSGRFRRAVAHHVYIDQAIRSREDGAPGAAFAAYDIGDASIEPGDLLCSARRPAYRTIAERRGQMGDGARTHCDLVVKLDGAGDRILAIGGNVRGVVSLKLLPAVREGDGRLRPASAAPGRSVMFAHLKLRFASIEADALDHSPTMKALGCRAGFRIPALTAVAAIAGKPGASTC